jgi:hypothetical protein
MGAISKPFALIGEIRVKVFFWVLSAFIHPTAISRQNPPYQPGSDNGTTPHGKGCFCWGGNKRGRLRVQKGTGGVVMELSLGRGLEEA